MDTNNNNTEKKVVALFTVWGIIVYLIGKEKLYASLPRQFFGLTVFASIVLLNIAFFKNKAFNQLANKIPLKYLALFNAWRIFGGAMFLLYKDSLPTIFVNEASYGDIIAGFVGIAVFLFFQNKIGYYIFNIIGLLDLSLALGIGMKLALTKDPQMAGIVELPLILIPMFGVPILVLTHIIGFARLYNHNKSVASHLK